MSTWPDVEGALRTYLRSVSAVTALVGQRVFFGIPKGAVEATFPLVVITRVGGGQAPGDAPLDVAQVQVDCWGSLDTSGNGVKSSATTLVNAVRTALEAVGTGSASLTGIEAGVNVESVLWLPDPDNDRPRYVVTAEVAAISS